MPETNAHVGTPAVSVVVPVRNEADNVGPLTDEIAAALNGRWRFELVFVNDGSTDGTEAALTALKAERPWLRQVKRHAASRPRCAAASRPRAHRSLPRSTGTARTIRRSFRRC